MHFQQTLLGSANSRTRERTPSVQKTDCQNPASYLAAAGCSGAINARTKAALLPTAPSRFSAIVTTIPVVMLDILESLRDATRNFMDLYLTSISIRTGEIMRVLTVVASIFIPLTFIAGIYGMNFDPKRGPLNMPELEWPFGYFSPPSDAGCCGRNGCFFKAQKVALKGTRAPRRDSAIRLFRIFSLARSRPDDF